jgi:hypothetical protein
MEIWPKTAISLHRYAMIEIVFFGPITDFAKFIPPKELVYELTVNYIRLQ